MDRAGSIKQIKNLLKKYHPDHCTDENLAPLYREITVRLNAALNRLKTAQVPAEEGACPPNGPAGDAPVLVKDQAWAYYKLGIGYYKNIHPDHFYQKNPGKTYQLRTREEQEEVLREIAVSFNLAEHYFKKLAAEYPGSPWKPDAERKLRLLARLRKSYDAGGIRESAGPLDVEDFIRRMGLKPLFR